MLKNTTGRDDTARHANRREKTWRNRYHPRVNAPETPKSAPEPERLSAREMLLQFIVIPLVLAGVCAAIFLGINWMTARDRKPGDYAQDLRSPDRRTRWIAAYEAARSDLADPELVPVLVELLEEKGADGNLSWSPIDALKQGGNAPSQIRWFAAQALGRRKDPRAVAPLRRALADADGGVRIHAALALGELAAVEAAEDLARLLAGDDDSGVRKASAVALGFLPGDRSRAALAKGLSDAEIQVRWNAALALARLGDGAAAPLLSEMLDRARVAGVQVPSAEGGIRAVTEPEIQGILTAAIRGAEGLDPQRFGAAIEKLESDPNLAVATLAKRARLESQKKAD